MVTSSRGRSARSRTATAGWRAGDRVARSRPRRATTSYSRPLYGLVGVVDLNAMEVVRIDDHGASPAPSGEGGDYRDGGGRPAAHRPPPDRDHPARGPELHPRRACARLAGVGRCDVGFHPREGLVLHDIATDAGERRQICHRASIAELVIPYGDPNPTVHFKNVFDMGEYGLGPLTNSLALGLRLPRRDPLPRRRHERLDRRAARDPERDLHPRGGREPALEAHRRPLGPGRSGPLAPARDLVDRDRRQLRVRLLLVPVSGRARSGSRPSSRASCTRPAGVRSERSPHSLPIGDGHRRRATTSTSSAPGSTWTSTARGTSACEVDALVRAVGARRTRTGARSGRRRACLRARVAGAGARRTRRVAALVRVENAARRNRIGEPVAYELIPGENVRPMQQPDSEVRERARFLDHHLWVTPYRRRRALPGGRVPQPVGPGGDGLDAVDGGRPQPARARTSCSGTCSGRTTFRGSRTGP